MVFSIGQRWISITESQLGLGIITEINGRQVHVHFPAADEMRIYAKDGAPLSRIIFKEGDEISTSKVPKLTVTEVKEKNGLLYYTAQDELNNQLQFGEFELNCFIKLSNPKQRLLSGLLDKPSAFKLRIETLNHLSRLQQSKAKGLIGSRTSHLPHQIYIAFEVAKRHAPRVMLADEVGLGKTIEAGMILHYQLHTGRAQRILIVVPEALIHQWFIEMRRRFNLNFSIFDEELFDESEDENNLFETEQLVLCGLDFLLENPRAQIQASSTHWDLLVVDEAHHLGWSLKEVSPEYSCIEDIAQHAKGLLLLTATPLQVGLLSHFSRLRLLDPLRFHDFESFKKEQEQYNKINAMVQELLEIKNQNKALPTEFKTALKPYFDKNIPTTIDEIINSLLDRHGTGRILFRNRRSAISGFPDREMHAYPLPCPSIYKSIKGGLDSLYPERLVDKALMLQEDPRLSWLGSKLYELAPEKVLVISASPKTASAIDHYLKRTVGLGCAVFHEGLSIIERDRAAAYFSEEMQGAQALICSEIGSEGRNFQFAHHLVLFDLPLNPDLLEQRIGRLDRIGQQQTVQIHVPYLQNTSQEVLFRWYQEGMDLFEKSAAIGYSIFENFKEELFAILEKQEIDEEGLNLLIEKTKIYAKELNQFLKDGQDKLLELNSCNHPEALKLIATIEEEENCKELEEYMSKVFQEFGVDQEHHSEKTDILRPTTQMPLGYFPGLKEEELIVTYSRNKALIREDIQFLSWEHPMVIEAMDMIKNSEFGNANISTISIAGIPPGTLFLETFYTINCAAPKHLQLERFLPPTSIRLFMDKSGKNLSKIMDYNQLNQVSEQIKRHLGFAIIKQIPDDIEHVLKQSNLKAEEEMEQRVDKAKNELQQFLSQEINRLQYLKQRNASIREEEIHFYKNQISESLHYLSHANLQLEAMRVIINK